MELSKNKKLDTSRSILKVRSMKQVMSDAKNQKIPPKLFGDLWKTGDLCILFSATNVGKTVLGFQIADAISSGMQPLPDSNLVNESKPLKTLYVDVEMSDIQISQRYKGYDFSTDNFLRADWEKDFRFKPGDDLEELVNKDIAKFVDTHKIQALIIDNLTVLKTGTETSKEAVPLMWSLQRLGRDKNISILVIGHTPKVDQYSPITINHLQGSAGISRALDSAFCIGRVRDDENLRYIKEVKQRVGSFTYGKSNVIVCEIDKPLNFTGFFFRRHENEMNCLNPITEDVELNALNQILKLNKQGKSLREIANVSPYGKDKVNQIIKEHTDRAVDSDNDDNKDSADNAIEIGFTEVSEVSGVSEMTEQTTVSANK
tara:strand:- start:146 stop:1264 length:1119 start_codon:yes stop_codon:yes gene_type:complete